jgi:hypothetical protein
MSAKGWDLGGLFELHQREVLRGQPCVILKPNSIVYHGVVTNGQQFTGRCPSIYSSTLGEKRPRSKGKLVKRIIKKPSTFRVAIQTRQRRSFGYTRFS